MSRFEALDFLVLHTSDATGTVAVASGERLAVQCLDPAGQHAQSVLGAVASVLAELDAQLDDLDGLVVTLGPGSFTGIRIGLATAQGLSAALDWDVHTCDSLRAEAAAFEGFQSPLAVVLDARRQEVYAALYDVTASAPRELVAPFCAAPPRAAQVLAAAAAGGGQAVGSTELALTGAGVPILRPHLRSAVGRAVELPLAAREDVARALLGLGRVGACAKMKPEELEPRYLRQSDAEIRRQDGHRT